jgi:hypothetical protein
LSNFRQIDRETGFLLPPSVDEWLPERHLARFIVEVVAGLDLRSMSGSYRGVRVGVVSPEGFAGASGVWLCDGSVFESQAGASDI